MKNFLQLIGLMAFLWLMIPLGPRLEPFVEWLVSRMVLPIAVGCLLGVMCVVTEVTLKGLKQLRCEEPQRKQTDPSAAA